MFRIRRFLILAAPLLYWGGTNPSREVGAPEGFFPYRNGTCFGPHFLLDRLGVVAVTSTSSNPSREQSGLLTRRILPLHGRYMFFNSPEGFVPELRTFCSKNSQKDSFPTGTVHLSHLSSPCEAPSISSRVFESWTQGALAPCSSEYRQEFRSLQDQYTLSIFCFVPHKISGKVFESLT